MKRFAFFPGCLIPARHPAMEFAIRHTLPKLGIEIEIPEPGSAVATMTVREDMDVT